MAASIYRADLVGNYSVTSAMLLVGRASDNRLIQHSNGSFEVLAKTPAEVFGERVVRPLLDTACTLATRSIQVLKSNFFWFDGAFSKIFELLPLAEAKEVDNTEVAVPAYSCPSLQALANAHARAKENQLENKQRSIVLRPASEVFYSSDEAKAYLEARMGPIEIPHTNCLAEKPIRLIINRKAPTALQKTDLKRAYSELQTLLDQDALRFCEPHIMELLSEFTTNLQQYSLSALDLLPNVLFSLLQHSGMDHTFADIDFLVTKINQLSREMVVKYQKTNHEKALQRWVDILLESAERNTDNSDTIMASFKTALKLLKSSSQEKLQREQKKKLRKMAIQYQTHDLSAQQAQLVAKVLQATGSKIRIVNFINSYLECLPDDMRSVNESLNDIVEVFYNNKKVQLLTGTAVLVPLALMPDRIKKALVIVSLALAINHFLF